MPTVNPLPPPPMRHKWGKHCSPICPPGYEHDVEGPQDIEDLGAAIVGDSGLEDGITGDLEAIDEDEDEDDEDVKDEDDQTHRDSSWPDHCEPPFCFPAAHPDTEHVLAELSNSLPRGGLVRGEAKLGSVELTL